MPWVSDEDYAQIQSQRQGATSRVLGGAPTFRSPGARPPEWKPPAYRDPTTPGWSASVAAGRPGQTTQDILSAGYNGQDPLAVARYDRARAQSRAAAPPPSDETQRMITEQSHANPGWEYRPSESGVGGYWVFTGGVKGGPPLNPTEGQNRFFNSTWQSIATESPDANGLSRDGEGWALDQYGNRIPGTQKGPPSAAPEKPMEPFRTGPNGEQINMPNGTPLADGTFADGRGGRINMGAPAAAPAPAAPAPAPPTPPPFTPPSGAGAFGAGGLGQGPNLQTIGAAVSEQQPYKPRAGGGWV